MPATPAFASSAFASPAVAPHPLPEKLSKTLSTLSKAFEGFGCPSLNSSDLMKQLRPLVEQKLREKFQLPSVDAPKKELEARLKACERLVECAEALGLDPAKQWRDDLNERRAEVETLAKRKELGLKEEQVLPPEFVCPITQEKMKDPVVATDGHSYERSAIEQVMRTTRKSPLTREPLSSGLVPNRNLKARIETHEAEIFALVEKKHEGASGSKSGKKRSAADAGSSGDARTADSKKRPASAKRKKKKDDDQEWKEGDD